MIYNTKRVEVIRVSAATGLQRISRLEAQTDDPWILKCLRLARNFFDEVDQFFLSPLERDGQPRTHEAEWLTGAELALSIANCYLDLVQHDIYDEDMRLAG